jgi:hypothetical protein
MYDLAGEMKRIERELKAANERINRLEEAGDALLNAHHPLSEENWRKAKEAKL